MQMCPTRVRQLTGCWLLLSLVCSALTVSAHTLGHVLCFGADGHIAIERAAGRDCVDYIGPDNHPPNPDQQRPVNAAHSKHCGSCLDFELVDDDLIAKFPHTETPSSPELPVILGHDELWPVGSVATVERVLPPIPLPSRTLRERRTVVLVI